MTSLFASAPRFAERPSVMRRVHDTADRIFGTRGCLFVFHRAASADRWGALPNREFYLDFDFLDRFLGYLRRTGWAVVTIEEAVSRLTESATGRFVNFSIDDCYRDTFEAVAPLFRSHGVPITCFVTTGIPDGTLPLWAAGLEDVLLERDIVQVGDEVVTARSAKEKRCAFAKIARNWDGPRAGMHYASFCTANGVDQHAMHIKHGVTWSMLEKAAHDPLIEIGAHTVNHPHISRLMPEEAFAEMKGSRLRLEERLGIPIRHFAFPYGQTADCGPRDVTLARQAGFKAVMTTSRGLARPGHDPFTAPRNTLNGAHKSLLMMEAHMSGLTGAAARVLGRV